MARAAFFQLNASYFGRPFDDGIIRALLANGFGVDVYAPGGELPQTLYDAEVKRCPVDYRRSWLLQNLRAMRRYDLFIGTMDIPMAFAGVFAAAARRPSIAAADELFIGGYEGEAFLHWKAVTRWALRRADLTVITDSLRIPLHQEYARAAAPLRYVTYPCCFSQPYAGRSRDEARRALGIAEDDFVLSFTGTFTVNNGAHWIVRLLDRTDAHVRILVQTGGRPDAVTDALLERLDAEGRLIYRPDRVEWPEAPQITIAADASAVFYFSPKPDFQNLGASSTKLGVSLWIGVPVIATRQPSFARVDDLGCGVTIDDEPELDEAIARIERDRQGYSLKAQRAVHEWLQPAESQRELEKAIRSLTR